MLRCLQHRQLKMVNALPTISQYQSVAATLGPKLDVTVKQRLDATDCIRRKTSGSPVDAVAGQPASASAPAAADSFREDACIAVLYPRLCKESPLMSWYSDSSSLKRAAYKGRSATCPVLGGKGLLPLHIR